MDYHLSEVEVYGFAAGVVDKQELIQLMMDELSDEMYRDMAAHVAATWDSVRRETKEYSLLGVKSSLAEKVAFPKGVKLELKGYEMLLKTPMPMSIRFGQGFLWIGRRGLVVCYREEIIAWFPYLVDHVLPCALTKWKEKRASVEKELLIQQKLEALDRMYKEAVK